MSALPITHFSDALCVWAYVSQVRCDELLAQFPEQVALDYRYFHVFGDVAGKIEKGWRKRGGLSGYAAHVHEVARGFPHAEIHPEAWVRGTPTSSMPAHLLLCAVRVLEAREEVAAGTAGAAAWRVRECFFRDARDVSDRAVLLECAEAVGAPAARVEALQADGSAHAALCADLELARELEVRASPTLSFNEGRQRLTGNVGYRILEANVRELLERPSDQSSWC